MLIHAHARTKPVPIEVAGQTFTFDRDEQGRIVCEVADPQAIKLLLRVREAFVELGADPDPGSADDDGDFNPFVITQGDDDEAIDLRARNDEQLHEFAKEHEIKVHPNAKGDTIRNRIMSTLMSVGGGDGDDQGQGDEKTEG